MPAIATPYETYVSHSWVTDPGALGALFDDLPHDVAALSAVVQGLVLHYWEGAMYGVEIPRERQRELDSRRVEAMLARLLELDDRPLTVLREPSRRLVGCCRDFSVLLCSMLRHQGVPVRVRFGFSSYFRPDFLCDHVVTEYWDGREGRWVLVDAQMDAKHRAMNRLDFDPLDTPRDRFILAGDAWERCRRGEIDPKCCGVDDGIAGSGFVGRYVIHDLAALNGFEPLCWDAWGVGDRADDGTWSEEEAELLDRVAHLTLVGDEAAGELQAVVQRPELGVPAAFTSYSPAGRYEMRIPARVRCGSIAPAPDRHAIAGDGPAPETV